MPVSDHRDLIEKMRKDGHTARQIADHIKATTGEVYTHKNVGKYAASENLPRKRRTYQKAMPMGGCRLGTALSPDQLYTLADLAKEWDCQTLSEAAIEILRDHLDEQAATR
jgi:hypothetical protein